MMRDKTWLLRTSPELGLLQFQTSSKKFLRAVDGRYCRKSQLVKVQEMGNSGVLIHKWDVYIRPVRQSGTVTEEGTGRL